MNRFLSFLESIEAVDPIVSQIKQAYLETSTHDRKRALRQATMASDERNLRRKDAYDDAVSRNASLEPVATLDTPNGPILVFVKEKDGVWTGFVTDAYLVTLKVIMQGDEPAVRSAVQKFLELGANPDGLEDPQYVDGVRQGFQDYAGKHPFR